MGWLEWSGALGHAWKVGSTPGMERPWTAQVPVHRALERGRELVVGLSGSWRWWEGKGRERGKEKGKKKKNLTQKPQGIFCLFRILGREKIATVIQSILDNNSLFTVCMQRWQAGSAVRGTGMRNSPGALRLRRRRRRRRAGAEEGTALQWGEPAWRAEPHSCTQSKPGREAACSAQLVYCAPQLVPARVLLYQTKTGGNPPSVQS